MIDLRRTVDIPATVLSLLVGGILPVSAVPELRVNMLAGTGSRDPQITFADFRFSTGGSVFDTLVHPVEFSNISFVNQSSGRTLTIVEGNAVTVAYNGFEPLIPRFEAAASVAVANGNLNNYLDLPEDFTFDDTFSYELAFSDPLLDNDPGPDEKPELLFTARGGNSYLFIEPLEAPNGNPLAGSTPFLVDTNGWFPATDAATGGAVPQLGNTELYFKAVDLSFLGTTSVQYFRVSNASSSTPGVTDFSARAINSGLGPIGIITVPEPTTGLLALIGFGGFAFLRKR